MAQIASTLGAGLAKTLSSKTLAGMVAGATAGKTAGNIIKYEANRQGQATANAISSASQAAQGAFNQASADNANAITQAMWEKAAEYNSAEAEKNRQWQEYMSNTAVQRQVADMKAAGINPILAAQFGGAYTGAGAQASMSGMQATQASENNYTGQFQLPDMLSLMNGVIGGMTDVAGAIATMAAGMGQSGKEIIHNTETYVREIFPQLTKEVEKASKVWTMDGKRESPGIYGAAKYFINNIGK